jgi:bifunctional oligoribonuclease and PAP phosphatase NrnA
MKTQLLPFDPSQCYLLCTHREPDPDGAGALLALWLYGQASGLNFYPFLDQCPPYMSFLPGYSALRALKAPNLSKPYTLIALDCGHESRVWPSELLSSAKSIWNIDHHADNPHFAQINIVEPSISSTCELLFNLMEASKLKRSLDINKNLLAGMLFDTGGFRYPNTSTETLQIASRLVSEGVSLTEISEKVFSRWSAKSYRALKLALQYMEFPFDERFLLSWIPYQAIKNEDLDENDFEGVIQVLREDAQAKIIFLIREMQANHFKGSLRSKASYSVNDIALRVNGGGHKLAAGFSTKEHQAQDLRRLLLQWVKEKLL